MVCDRVIRQFRSIGDALAWRLFNFDRRFIDVLAANRPAGPMVHKKGLDYELGRVVDLWEHKKHFGLLHDLTTCLRIADISEFTGDGVLFHEVKKNPKRQDPAQLRRMQAAIDTLEGKTPLRGEQGEATLFRSNCQFKSHLRRLERIVQLARERGCVAVPIESQYVVVATSLRSPAFPADGEEAIRLYQAARDAAINRAGFNRANRQFRAFSADVTARSPIGAPLGIYPLPTEDCADLISDYLIIEIVTIDEVLLRAFRGVGFEGEVVLPPNKPEISLDDKVFLIGRGSRSIGIHGRATNQLLMEMVDIPRYAAALTRALRGGPGDTRCRAHVPERTSPVAPGGKVNHSSGDLLTVLLFRLEATGTPGSIRVQAALHAPSTIRIARRSIVS